LLSAGCGARTGRAATLPDGSKIAILVVPDRNYAPETPPDRSKQLNQLLDWMEADLVDLLRDTGYAAAVGTNAATNAAANRYVLRVRVTEYEGVTRMARFLADAARAGSARLKVHFELIGQGGAVVASGDPSEDGALDWAKAARRVDKQTVRAVNGWIRLEN
jgi:hypothetical protein